MKFALISHVLPPYWSGQSVVIYRLLKDLAPGCYCLISKGNNHQANAPERFLERLPGKYFQLPEELQLTRGNKFPLAIGRKSLNFLIGIASRARHITRVLTRENCDLAIACSGDLIDLPATFLACRSIRIPFCAYIFDDYLYQWTDPVERFLVKSIEPTLLRNSAAVIVPNESLHADLIRRYSVHPYIIHNPSETQLDIEKNEEIDEAADTDEFQILYTGAIYHAHFDAFRNLVSAIRQINNQEVKLHLYTAQSVSDLTKQGIEGPVVFHAHLPHKQILQIQRKADLLFLPLAFQSPIPEVINTSAPGKMGEYLSSGQAILVHAPGGSFVAQYFTKHRCGWVVDQNNPSLLAQAILYLKENHALRKELGENALHRAKADFDLKIAQEKFESLLQTIKEKSACES